jgi:hypothetical protein
VAPAPASGPAPVGGACTEPVCRGRAPARIRHGAGSKIKRMDALAIALGVAMFALLYALIYAIDRI